MCADRSPKGRDPAQQSLSNIKKDSQRQSKKLACPLSPCRWKDALFGFRLKHLLRQTLGSFHGEPAGSSMLVPLSKREGVLIKTGAGH